MGSFHGPGEGLGGAEEGLLLGGGPRSHNGKCLRFRTDAELGKRTPSHDRVLDGETPAKEIGVGRSATREVAFGGRLGNVAAHLGRITLVGARESNTGDDGDKGSQGWEKGEEPHSGV